MINEIPTIDDPCYFCPQRVFKRDGVRLKTSCNYDVLQDLRSCHEQNAQQEVFLSVKEEIEKQTTYDLDQDEIDWLIENLKFNIKFSVEYQVFCINFESSTLYK